MSKVSSGLLGDGIPYLKVGEGPPLVMVQGLTPTHDVPTGLERRMALSGASLLAGGEFSVYVVNRKRELRQGESMSDIAGHLARGIENDLGEPVFLAGTSTGGSVSLQLAVDRPELVRALVVVSSAYRLGPNGRRIQQELARLTRAGRGADGWAQLMTAMMPAALRSPMKPVARMMSGTMVPEDPSDLLVTLDAEDAFDVGDQLHRISAPTLVIGGGRDVFYPRELFEKTAARVENGRAHVYADWGHGRTSVSSATSNLMLGFFLAARRPDRQDLADSVL
jgi:pimeloyl-ACP methyl ester carboxylesterase